MFKMYYKLLKNGQVLIPKRAQKHLSIKDGDFLYLYQQGDLIVIVKHHSNETLNQCIFRNGRISIPVELRTLIGITPSSLLEIHMDNTPKKIIISMVKQNFLKKA